MSDIEETLERIKNQRGVESYIICQNDGTILRRHNLSQEDSQKFSKKVIKLVQSGRNYVRDVGPMDDLRILRIRANEKELLITCDREFLVICVQKWNSTTSNA